jgi:hypothetical protein
MAGIGTMRMTMRPMTPAARAISPERSRSKTDAGVGILKAGRPMVGRSVI